MVHIHSIPTGSYVMATTILVTIRRANYGFAAGAAPPAALARFQEEQNNVGWLPKLNAHAQNLKSILGTTQHCSVPSETSQGWQFA